MGQRKIDRAGIFIGTAMILAGVICTGLALAVIHEGRETLSWPQAKGKVLHWHIVKRTSSSSSGGRRHRTTRTTTRYHVRVRYAYRVGEKTYIGTRYAVGRGWHAAHSRGAARAWARRHAPVDKRLRVFYDPAAPEQSVVRRGVSPFLYFALLLLAVVAGAGTLFVQHALAVGRPGKPSKQRLWIVACSVSALLAVVDVVALLLI